MAKPILNRQSNPPDLRAMLLGAGVGNTNAPMAIQYMNFLPTTTEPYAPGTQIIVKGLQRLLVKRGQKIPVDGGMGPMTVRAIILYCGPRWYEMSWAQIYEAVTDGRLWTSWNRESRAPQDAALKYYDAEMAKHRGLSGLGATRFSTDQVADYVEMGHTAYHHLGDVAGNYKMVANVAVPLNAETLATFQNIQREINSFLIWMKKSPLGIDGRIGPQTASALDAIMKSKDFPEVGPMVMQIYGVAFSPLTIALFAAQTQEALRQLMNRYHIALAPDQAASNPSVLVGGSVVNPSDASIIASSAVQTISSNVLPIAALTVGALLLFGKKKGRRR